ncbi:extracellular solute-binding protein [Antribacter gilvus]|uniref:extracellular solute-binding protein n=1 Tax=Antribacter gilvus TaxID=2304675 RepID=UPI00197EDEF5|nr:extracellular solute-binding protein [Antribacter gilvus]
MRMTKAGPVVAATAAIALTLTACGGGDEADGSGEVSTKDSITWMTMLHTATTPEADAGIEAELEKYTGLGIEMQWVPDASKDEKINAALASDSLPDLVSLTNITNTTVRQAMASGQFWDVQPYLADYPNLSKIPEATLESAKIDGGLYGVPYQKPVARYGVLVRQDWLDNLGLEVPHTIEDLTEVARAFSEDDPDGNGQDDTVGFYDRSESFLVGFRSLAGYFGAGQHFEVNDDGEVVPSFTTESFKEAMEWYRGIHEKGWMNEEFVTVQKQNQKDGIAQGKGGIVVSGLFEAKNFHEAALAADPASPMAWALINDMTYDDVDRRILTDTNGGMGGWLAVPRSQITTEADLRVVLGFIDKLMDEEPFDLMTNGIEGVHYELDADGVVSMLDNSTWEQEVQPFGSSRPSERVTVFKTSNEYTNLANELMAQNADYVVVNPAQSLTSKTYDTQWSTIQQQVNDAYNQYMVGQIEMADFEAVVEGLRGQGLDQVIAEFTESYEKANG